MEALDGDAFVGSLRNKDMVGKTEMDVAGIQGQHVCVPFLCGSISEETG